MHKQGSLFYNFNSQENYNKMKLLFNVTFLSAIFVWCQIFCCHAEGRQLLDQPGFGGEEYDESSLQEQEYTNVDGDDEGIHMPFQSRIVGGTVVDGSNYPFHVNLGGCGGTL